nr:MAG TPA: hypothetical protein [Caudoviricetes sp.]
MNGIVEIIIFAACGMTLAAFSFCFCSEGVLSHRYKKFYETTEEGKKLYIALYTIDRLDSKQDRIENQMSELRDRINEFESYFPEECKEKAVVCGMKVQYREYSEEIDRTKKKIIGLEKHVNEMVVALPKKYKGILEYNWANAKVEVEEESICW